MFTGLVEAMGRIAATEPRAGGLRVWIDAGNLAAETAPGDSVAVDGCCLTVVGREGPRLAFDAIPETLARTTLGRRDPGDRVNLELPLRPGDRLGGHFVQGHVDAVAEVVDYRAEGDDVVMTFRLPEALRSQVVEKGSIAIDGVSMTVAAVKGDTFSVALIPHTLAVTTLGVRRPGDAVNLEGDILAKYVAVLVAPR
ncbi:MAG: riboflavin synthase [Planctomycetota bacterium]|jgi:riboflavin synthase